MKIRTKLTLRYSLVTALVFTLFVVFVYLFSEQNREKEFFRTLRAEGVTKLNLAVEGEIDATILQSIYRNNREFINEVEVAVYDMNFNLLYHDAVDIDIVKETPEMLTQARISGLLQFHEGRYQAVAFIYTIGNEDFFVTAAAFDGHGFARQRTLAILLIALWLIGILIIIPSGYFLARAALSPVAKIINEVEHISDFNPDVRLIVNSKQDELSILAETFNEMLNRLEKSYDSQKMFVSNISHELRTPLAAIIADIELTLRYEHTPQEYTKIMENVLSDARRMERLSKGLLDLARTGYNTAKIAKDEVRLDEALLNARDTVTKNHKNFKVELIFNEEIDDEKQITVFGNEYLLKTAFINLIENNCKFSANKTSTISISACGDNSVIRFSDNGIGMTENEIEKIFTPFYRGENKEQVQGYGIGMALVNRILLLHNGKIEIQSSKGKGTTFVVTLPHV
jgi:signal transduction histidine kinase